MPTKLFILLTLLCPILLIAQSKDQSNDKEPIEIKHADILRGTVVKGEELRILKGNVIIKQGNTFLYCDSAHQYVVKNYVQCFGNIRMTQGDSVTLTSKSLNYDGNKKIAVVTKDVVMKDRKMTLTTDYLDFNTKTNIASYQQGGHIVDVDNDLTSKRGYYSSVSKKYWFKKDVVLINKKQNFTLTSDTLEYNTLNGVATFRGPSKVIKGEKGEDELEADYGDYDTRKGRSMVTGRAKVRSKDYRLEADVVNFDEVNKHGVAKGNVKVISDTNHVTIYGQSAIYSGDKGLMKVYDNPLVQFVSKQDTFYLSADTILSLEFVHPLDSTKKVKNFYAYHHAQLLKGNISASCDSLVYLGVDSILHFYRNPKLWQGKSQITSDTLFIELKNGKIWRLNANVNAFVVEEDTLLKYNQIKGKTIIAYFKDNKIQDIYVKGNGQTLYNIIDGDTIKTYTGLNKADCSKIAVHFNQGKIEYFTFQTKPDAKMIPPNLIKEDDIKLSGFQWLYDLKPNELSVFRGNIPDKFQPKLLKVIDSLAIDSLTMNLIKFDTVLVGVYHIASNDIDLKLFNDSIDLTKRVYLELEDGQKVWLETDKLGERKKSELKKWPQKNVQIRGDYYQSAKLIQNKDIVVPVLKNIKTIEKY